MKPKTIKVKILNLLIFVFFLQSCGYKNNQQIFNETYQKFNLNKKDLIYSNEEILNLNMTNDLFVITIFPRQPDRLVVKTFNNNVWAYINTESIMSSELKSYFINFFRKNEILDLHINKRKYVKYPIHFYRNHRDNEYGLLYCVKEDCHNYFVSKSCIVIKDEKELKTINNKDCWAYQLEDGWYIYSE